MRRSTPLTAAPPEAALRWAAAQIGGGSRVAALRRLTAGGWHANHALTIVDRRGTEHRLVLRRWARPEWSVEDPDSTAAREAAVLELLARSPVPAPRLVAADADGAACDVPALLITRLPGGPPGLPGDMDRFLLGLAQALAEVHAAGAGAEDRVPPYRRYYDQGALAPPAWSRRPRVWERALQAVAAGPPPGPRRFIHRDYHPENTLWSRGRLTGVVDWTSASWGPAAVDTGHMRWNLAVTYGPDAAAEFLRVHRSMAGEAFADQRHWDLVTALDVVPEIGRGGDWARFDLDRLEHYVEAVLAEAS